MLRTYLKNKQQSMNEQVDCYTSSGVHVYFKDKIENQDVNVEKVIATVESKVPHHLLSELEMIVVGWFKEFEET